MLPSSDPEIRAALHQRKLKIYRDAPQTIVVDELGLSHSKVRIDIAVINRHIHGYEIKSASDTLKRLQPQIELYAKCLSKLTIVGAPRHMERVAKIAPPWSGLIEAKKGSSSIVTFKTHRRAQKNPDVDPFELAHLLWRPEAITLLAQLGASSKDLRRPRKQIYTDLAASMNIKDLTTAIRDCMSMRRSWRDHLVPA